MSPVCRILLLVAMWLASNPLSAYTVTPAAVLAEHETNRMVRSRGVVTYADLSQVFIQQGSEAYELQLPPNLPQPSVGQAVDCLGIRLDSRLPVLAARSITLLSEEPFPAPLPLRSASGHRAGDLHGRYVEVEARIRSLRHDAIRKRWFLGLYTQDLTITAEFQASLLNPELRPGTLVRVQGVLDAAPPPENLSPALLANSILMLDPGDSRSPSTLSLAEALAAPGSNPVKTHAVVTYRSPDRCTFAVQSGTHAAFLHTSQPLSSSPGDPVQIVAFAGTREGRRVFEEASLSSLQGDPPSPLATQKTPQDLATGSYDALLVRVRARFLAQTNTAQGLAFYLKSDDTRFLAIYPAGLAAIRLSPNARIEISGVCRMHSPGVPSRGFSVLLRDSTDIRPLATGSIIRAVLIAALPLLILSVVIVFGVWWIRRSVPRIPA